MIYRRLGRSGLQVSALGLGSWVTFGKQVAQSDALELMARAYDAGINFFDNAEGYEAGESERLMGEALAKLGWSRDTFVVSSKVFWGGDKPNQKGLSRKHVFDACHAALKRLQVDYLDLYYCHRPDIDTPIEETVRAMNDLISQGKVLYWGTSEWSAQQIMEAHMVARQHHLVGPVMEQPQYHLFCRERVEGEYARLYDTVGLGLTTFSPLYSGLLTGKYNDGIPEGSRLSLPGYEWLKEEIMDAPDAPARFAKVRQLGEIATELEVPLSQLALAWCISNPRVSSVILGCSKLRQLEDNLGALEVLPKVTPELKQRIDELLGNQPVGPERF